MSLPANTAWFTLTLNGRTDFSVFSFSGEEAVSTPYEFSVELLHPSDSENPTSFIGAPALLRVRDRSGQARPAHGLVREMKYLRRGNHLAHYQCVIVPRLWFLGQTRNHRIFQHQSAPEIIRRILEEQNFTADSFAFKCFHDYPEREYCVQYGESDLHFISRLCEEEGIYYYFEHTENGHCLCFSDMPGGPRIAGEAALRYFPGSGQPADTAVVSRATILSRSVSDRATLRDWNFLTPSAILESSAFEAAFDKAPAVPGMRAETYRSPHLYQTREEGARHAALQLRRQLTFQTCLEAEADVSRFLPGFTFTLFGHERAELNAGWWIVGVAHRGEQPQALGREAPDRGMTYASRLTAIPETTRFVPDLTHPRSRIWGDQTAIVTGPADEEIYPDAYGRVKVQFFWDREGKQDENTCCWIRVSQGWAGTEFGAMALPRIGQEVIVSFLEGDPDRPLITGRLYNAGAMPPHPLPAHKTRTVLRSMSSPGGDGPGGFNELRLEDKAGEEEMYLHAEKDVNIHIKNDWKEHILRDKHVSVDRHAYVRTQRETHETLDGARKTELHANDNLILRATSHAAIDGSWLCRVGAETHLYAGETAVFEAGTEATLKGGASWIRFTPSGVAAGGSSVSLGGGKMPKGRTAPSPQAPQTSFTLRTPTWAQSTGKQMIAGGALPKTAPSQKQELKVEEIRLEGGSKLVPCSVIRLVASKFNKENPTDEEKKSVRWEIEKTLFDCSNHAISWSTFKMIDSQDSTPSAKIKLCYRLYNVVRYKFTPYINDKKQLPSKTIFIKSMEIIRYEILAAANIIAREKYSAAADITDNFEEDCNYSCIVIHHAGNSFTKDSRPEELWKESYSGIPYHYIIDDSGNIYEGRHIRYKGSHVYGGNSRRIGICFLGDYASENDFSTWGNGVSSITDYITKGRDMNLNEKNIQAAELLIQTLTEYFNIKELCGHREVAELIGKNLTICPGNNLMPWVEKWRQKFALSAPEEADLRDSVDTII